MASSCRKMLPVTRQKSSSRNTTTRSRCCLGFQIPHVSISVSICGMCRKKTSPIHGVGSYWTERILVLYITDQCVSRNFSLTRFVNLLWDYFPHPHHIIHSTHLPCSAPMSWWATMYSHQAHPGLCMYIYKYITAVLLWIKTNTNQTVRLCFL